MSDPVVIPGGRDVRAVRDGPAGDRLVVACPPHPQMGGSNSDVRLRAVGDALADRSIACLRFDYGPWDEGRGEVTDAVRACEWAHERAERVGLFGYSFGGGVALLAAAEADPAAVSVLAPAGTIGDRDTTGAVADLSAPLQVVYGERDDTADWAPVVAAARERGATLLELGADHFFAGQHERVAGAVAEWFGDVL